MSLRTKLTLTHTLVALLAIILVALVINLVINSTFRRLALAQAGREAALTAEQVSEAYARAGSWAELRRRLGPRLPQRISRGRRVLLADTTGQIVLDSQGTLEGSRLSPRQREAAAPVLVNGRSVGTVAVLPAAGRLGEREDRFLQSVNRLIVLASLSAAVAAGLVGLRLAGRLTQPLQALTAAAQRLAGGVPGASQPVQPLPVSSRDELGALTTAFNRMAAELARQEQLRRQLVADIAHELRTPLSVLRMQLEGLEDGVLQLTPTVLGSLQEEVQLLGRLVGDLRLLSLAEAGQLSLTLAPVEAGAVLERVAALSAGQAQQRGVELRAEVLPALPPVWADQQRLAQVLGNLVDNALRYTPAGGRVTLQASVAPAAKGQPPPQEIWLSVADTGPGIPAAELERVFERFYRTDPARARETGGSGLGLTIVRGLVTAMGGRVWAEAQQGAGARFVVALHVSARDDGTPAPSPLTAQAS